MSDIVDIGSLPNDGTGDPLRVAFDKINTNFVALAELAPNGPNGSFQFRNGNYYLGTANVVFDSTNNKVDLGANLVPLTDANVSIGSNLNKIDKLYLKTDALRLGGISVIEDGTTLTFPITVLPSQSASIVVNNVTAQGNVSVGGTLELANASFNTFTITTPDNTPGQIIYEMPVTGFNSGTFNVTSREFNSDNSQRVTLSVTKSNDELSANYSAHSTVFIGLPVTRYAVDVGYGNIRVMVNPIRDISIDHIVSYDIQK